MIRRTKSNPVSRQKLFCSSLQFAMLNGNMEDRTFSYFQMSLTRRRISYNHYIIRSSFSSSTTISNQLSTSSLYLISHRQHQYASHHYLNPTTAHILSTSNSAHAQSAPKNVLRSHNTLRLLRPPQSHHAQMLLISHAMRPMAPTNRSRPGLLPSMCRPVELWLCS